MRHRSLTHCWTDQGKETTECCQADDCRVRWPSGSLTLPSQRYSKVLPEVNSLEDDSIVQFFSDLLRCLIFRITVIPWFLDAQSSIPYRESSYLSFLIRNLSSAKAGMRVSLISRSNGLISSEIPGIVLSSKTHFQVRRSSGVEFHYNLQCKLLGP